MYGILRAPKSKHTLEEYNNFKAYYCGLCDSLGNTFGHLSRATVNYDLTFFYIVLDGISADSQRSRGFCPTTPWQKRQINVNQRLHKFTAAVNIYLAGMKLKDDLHDQKNLGKKLGYRVLCQQLRKAEKILMAMGVDVGHADQLFRQQIVCESAGKTLADYYKNTAHGLAFLFAEGSKRLNLDANIQKTLSQFGYQLGKVIYIMDSFVDYPSDTKNEQFNALAKAFGDKIKLKNDLSPEIREEVYQELTTSLHQMQTLVSAIQFKKNKDLIELILNNLQQKICLLVKNTQSMDEVEKIIQASSPAYLLTHPVYFFKSRAAHRDYRHQRRHNNSCCCPDCDNLLTTAICCDAADCDCDSLECLRTGNPCELLECFC